MGTCDRSPGIEQEGRALVERLGGRWTPAGGICRCPAHDDRTPSLSVRPGRTRLLLHCFAACAAPDILRELRSLRLIEPGAGARSHGLPPARRSSASAARRVWSKARPLAGSPAEAYLAKRGLASGSPQLRYHPRTPSGPAPVTRYRPALIAAVRTEEGLVAIHRTFLDSSQVSHVSAAGEKRGLGPFGAGAVRLGGAPARGWGLPKASKRRCRRRRCSGSHAGPHSGRSASHWCPCPRRSRSCCCFLTMIRAAGAPKRWPGRLSRMSAGSRLIIRRGRATTGTTCFGAA